MTGYILVGKQARKGQINKVPLGPTEELFTDGDAQQEIFRQKRGVNKHDGVPTGDVRELQKDEILDAPISAPRVVKKSGNKKSSFYGDDC